MLCENTSEGWTLDSEGAEGCVVCVRIAELQSRSQNCNDLSSHS